MKEEIINGLRFLLAVAIGGLIGCAIEGRHERANGAGPGSETSVQVDSVKTQVDTSVTASPEPAETRPRDTVYIKVYLSKKDPEIAENVPGIAENVSGIAENVPEIADSVLYLPVLLEQKVYEDSTYRAVVSGPSIEQYGPRLDSISIYSRKTTVYQTKTVYVEPSPWSFGVTAGVTVTGKGVEPGITAGVTYTIWRPKKHKR